MISLINRLKKKKGFTIIEIVVVLAIMGVILAMVVPNMFTSDKPQRGNALAKDFFYKAQDTMSIAKIAFPETFGSGASAVSSRIYYAVLDDMGDVTETGVYSSGFTATNMTVTNAAALTDKTDDYMTEYRFNECCKNYLVSNDKMAGLVFVKVNSDFAVEGCYWIGIPGDTPKDDFEDISNLVASDDNVVSGYYCGAYPGSLVYKGETFLS